MLLISSWIKTVLPTPAPPKRPIFPPRAYGARRSTTLMPVTRISAVVELLGEGRGLGVDRQPLLRLDRTTLVDGIARHVHDAAQGSVSHGNCYGSSGIRRLGATDETLGTWSPSAPEREKARQKERGTQNTPSIAIQRTVRSPRCCWEAVSRIPGLRDSRNGAMTYRHLEDKLVAAILNLDGIQNLGKGVRIESQIHDGTDDLGRRSLSEFAVVRRANSRRRLGQGPGARALTWWILPIRGPAVLAARTPRGDLADRRAARGNQSKTGCSRRSGENRAVRSGVSPGAQLGSIARWAAQGWLRRRALTY